MCTKLTKKNTFSNYAYHMLLLYSLTVALREEVIKARIDCARHLRAVLEGGWAAHFRTHFPIHFPMLTIHFCHIVGAKFHIT